MHKLRTLLVRGRKRTDGLASPYVLNMTRDSPVASYTVLSKLRAAYADTAPELPASECMDHLAAGIDTTGDGLCFLLHRLSQPAAYPTQAALRAELAVSKKMPCMEPQHMRAADVGLPTPTFLLMADAKF